MQQTIRIKPPSPNQKSLVPTQVFISSIGICSLYSKNFRILVPRNYITRKIIITHQTVLICAGSGFAGLPKELQCFLPKLLGFAVNLNGCPRVWISIVYVCFVEQNCIMTGDSIIACTLCSRLWDITCIM